MTGFLRAALAWLVLGTGVGAGMALHPAWVVYRTAHFHMLLLGFVIMMIAGVAYHVIPRFAMAALASVPLARLHLGLANVGLALLVIGFWQQARGHVAVGVLATGGITSLAGTWCFAWNIWRTLDRAAPMPARMPSARPLPTRPH